MLNTLFDTTHTARIPTTRFLFIPPMRREKKQASVVIVFLYTFFSKLARANSSKRCRRRCVYLLFLLLFSSSTKQQLKSLRAARHKTRGTIRQNIQRAIPDCKIQSWPNQHRKRVSRASRYARSFDYLRFILFALSFHVFHAHRIHAVSLRRRGESFVFKHVPEMPVAFCTDDFHSSHAKRLVDIRRNRPFVALIERWPTASAVEL